MALKPLVDGGPALLVVELNLLDLILQLVGRSSFSCCFIFLIFLTGKVLGLRHVVSPSAIQVVTCDLSGVEHVVEGPLQLRLGAAWAARDSTLQVNDFGRIFTPGLAAELRNHSF